MILGNLVLIRISEEPKAKNKKILFREEKFSLSVIQQIIKSYKRMLSSLITSQFNLKFVKSGAGDS